MKLKPPPNDHDFDYIVTIAFGIAVMLGFLYATDSVSAEFFVGGIVGASILVFTVAQIWE